MKKKELLIIFLLAVLVTWGTGFVSHPALGCGFKSPMPDALCESGWPLVFHRVGGVLGFNQWFWSNIVFDFFFWFLVLAGDWWVIRKLRTEKW